MVASCRRAHVSKLSFQHSVCHRTHSDAFNVWQEHGALRSFLEIGVLETISERFANAEGDTILEPLSNTAGIVAATLCMINSKM